MSEWKKTRLGDVGRVVTGTTPPTKHPEYFGDDYLFVTPSDLTYDTFYVNVTERGLSQTGYATFAKRCIPKNSTMFTCIASIGKIGLSKATVLTNQQINSIVPRSESNPVFVYYWLKHYAKSIGAQYSGCAVPIIKKQAFENIELPLPPRPIQDRIAGILSDYDSAIANCRKQIALLEEAAMRLYREWFKDGKGEKKRLVEIADVTYGYPFSSSLFNSKHEGLPIIRIRNVPLGFSDDYTTEVAKEAYLVHDGDLLIGMDGEFHMNFWSGGNAWLVQRTCRIQPKDSMLTGFLMEAIKNPIRAFQSSIVGSTVGHLGKSDIDTIDVPVIDDDRIPIAEVLQKMYCERLALSLQIRTLTEARGRLLPKLMKGEVAV